MPEAPACTLFYLHYLSHSLLEKPSLLDLDEINFTGIGKLTAIELSGCWGVKPGLKTFQ